MKRIHHDGTEYILANSLLAEDKIRILKQDDTFAVLDRYGDISGGEEGLYHRGSRYLSHLDMQINGNRPILLASSVDDNNLALRVDLTTTGVNLSKGVLHVCREMVIVEEKLVETVTVRNYGSMPQEVTLTYHLDADFVDVFEVRGFPRLRPAMPHISKSDPSSLCFTYNGSDHVIRRLVAYPSPHGTPLSDGWSIDSVIVDTFQFSVVYDCQHLDHSRNVVAFLPGAFRAEQAMSIKRVEISKKIANQAYVTTDNELFNEWIAKSVADLAMLESRGPVGCYPHAGVPWFNAIFGRDGLWTGLQTLILNPKLSRDILRNLVHTQAKGEDCGPGAQAGKIIHEVRDTELNATGEVLFGRNYASVDATPLFILLAGEYLKVTGDVNFLREIEPALSSAVAWMETFGDSNNDGFLDYCLDAETGLIQQCWKDSDDSVFHADGTDVVGPVAPVEVQGYVIAAYEAMANIAQALGNSEKKLNYAQNAAEKRKRFHASFWVPELNNYALALDDRRPCNILGSNIGHCLYTGAVDKESAAAVARYLVSSQSFTGFGVRTLASHQVRYNPMSYHNGSCWPHDTGIVCAGLARYGYKKEALEILDAMFAVACHLDGRRLPELFCGFERHEGQKPILYPMACAPQAWAAGSVFMMLFACLGLEVDGATQSISITQPALPPSLPCVQIHRLKVGEKAEASLEFNRFGSDVEIRILERRGDIHLTIRK